MVWDELLALQLGARRGRGVSFVMTSGSFKRNTFSSGCSPRTYAAPRGPRDCLPKERAWCAASCGNVSVGGPLASRARSMSACDVTEGCPCYYRIHEVFESGFYTCFAPRGIWGVTHQQG